MTNDVRNLEREVEIARSRLKSDLSVLSSPRTYAAFKEDLKSEANSTVNNLIDGLKARAAANPAAALAIGAGIAWRVIERPPIAAALIGAGLFSLFRTTPVKSSPFQQRDYFAEGRQRLTEQVSDFAEEIRDEAVDMARSAAKSRLATPLARPRKRCGTSLLQPPLRPKNTRRLQVISHRRQLMTPQN